MVNVPVPVPNVRISPRCYISVQIRQRDGRLRMEQRAVAYINFGDAQRRLVRGCVQVAMVDVRNHLAVHETITHYTIKYHPLGRLFRLQGDNLVIPPFNI